MKNCLHCKDKKAIFYNDENSEITEICMEKAIKKKVERVLCENCIIALYSDVKQEVKRYNVYKNKGFSII